MIQNLKPVIEKSLPLGGKPIIETLYELVNLMEGVVQTLEAHCLGRA